MKLLMYSCVLCVCVFDKDWINTVGGGFLKQMLASIGFLPKSKTAWEINPHIPHPKAL